MTWTRFPASTWGLEAMPIGAAEQVDLIRGNIDHLMRQSPASGSCQSVNGPRTTNAVTYTDASTLFRLPRLIDHAGIDRQFRNIEFRLQAYMSAGTGTLRVTASRSWGLVADPPGVTDIEAETAVGAITSVLAAAPDLVTLTLVMTSPQLLPIMTGADPIAVDRVVPWYYAGFLACQGITNNVVNTLTLKRIAWREVDP